MCIYTRSTYNIRIYGGYVNDGLWKKRRDPGEKCVRVLLLHDNNTHGVRSM